MSISLIAIADSNYGIGYKGQLLDYIPRDLAYFKKLTLNHTVLLGRKSYESIIQSLGKPLPERRNIVFTRNPDYLPYSPEDWVVESKEQFLKVIYPQYEDEEIFVCGGAELYNQFMPVADKIYLTLIHNQYAEVDTYFPHINPNEWEVSSVEFHEESDNNRYPVTFIELERK